MLSPADDFHTIYMMMWLACALAVVCCCLWHRACSCRLPGAGALLPAGLSWAGHQHTDHVLKTSVWYACNLTVLCCFLGPTLAFAGCQVQERYYRLGSVGQDTNLCLWDLVIEEDPLVNAATGQTGGLK
jgi:hypothetical protein